MGLLRCSGNCKAKKSGCARELHGYDIFVWNRDTEVDSDGNKEKMVERKGRRSQRIGRVIK